MNVAKRDVEELMIQSWEHDPVYPKEDNDDEGEWKVYRKKKRSRIAKK